MRRIPLQNDMPDSSYIEVLRPFAADLVVEVNGLLSERDLLRARVEEYEEQERGLVAEMFALMECRDQQAEEITSLRARVLELENGLRELIASLHACRSYWARSRSLLGLEVDRG